MALNISVKRRVIRLEGRLARLICRFRKNENGATAVEFALISIPFLGLLFAIFETAFVFFATQGVEAAVNDAARLVMTGQVQYNAAITSSSSFKTNIICNPAAPKVRILPSFIPCSALILDIRTAASFAAANTSMDFINNPSETFCTGARGDIMVVRLVYPMPVYLSFLAMRSMAATDIVVNTAGQTMYKGSMKHMLMGTAVFRNEPFPEGTRAVPAC